MKIQYFGLVLTVQFLNYNIILATSTIHNSGKSEPSCLIIKPYSESIFVFWQTVELTGNYSRAHVEDIPLNIVVVIVVVKVYFLLSHRCIFRLVESLTNLLLLLHAQSLWNFTTTWEKRSDLFERRKRLDRRTDRQMYGRIKRYVSVCFSQFA